MNYEKWGKGITIGGLVFTGIVMLVLIGFSFTQCAKKPLGPGEDQHWSAPNK